MLTWMGGSAMVHRNEEDIAPQTPAPLFVGRALRSALLGAPRLDQTILEADQELPQPRVEEGNRKAADMKEPEESGSRDAVSATPAPFFIARAFKSAILGTPRLDQTVVADEDARSSSPGNRIIKQQVDSAYDTKGEPEMSPSKKGILRTPGTANTKRKNVVFGGDVKQDDGGIVIGKSGLPSNCPGKFPSPFTPRHIDETAPKKETALTKLLEGSREQSRSRKTQRSPQKVVPQDFEIYAEPLGNEENEPREIGARGRSAALHAISQSTPDEASIQDDDDRTCDLNSPHSASGRYWKSEFQRYHGEAKDEMRKLLKYKQMAKSYARKKDREAIALAEQLAREQQKIVKMERRLEFMANQITARREQGTDDAFLKSDLARQTALTAQYRDEVDQFAQALQDENGSGKKRKPVSPRTAKTLHSVTEELVRAREQVREMHILRSEVHSLKLSVSMAEKKASKLQTQNEQLASQLSKAQSNLIKQANRQLGNPSPESDLQRRYDDMKRLAKNKRVEAEGLLKKAHDEKMVLKREIRSLKRELSAAKAMPTKEIDAPSRKESQPTNHTAAESPTAIEDEISRLQEELDSREDDLPARLQRKSEEIKKCLTPARDSAYDRAALTEITPRRTAGRGHLRDTRAAMTSRAAVRMPISPHIAEPRNHHNTTAQAPQNPPPTTTTTTTSLRLSESIANPAPHHRTELNKENLPPQATSMRLSPRKELAPDRAAAAKARLEARQAERLRAQMRIEESILRERAVAVVG